MIRPVARRRGLVIREVSGELLAYDLDRDKAFCLNQTAALIWRRCDGTVSPEDLAKILEEELGAPADQEIVWRALLQLRRHRLLETPMAPPAGRANTTRRQHLRSLAKAAAVAAPLVTAVVAPTAAEAASCLRTGQGCATSAQCCSGLCAGSACT